VTKTYGNLVLMTTICALVLLASMPAYARPQVVVGKPRIVTVTIRGSMLPPPKYDKPYEGELEIVFFSNSEDIKKCAPICTLKPRAPRTRMISRNAEYT